LTKRGDKYLFDCQRHDPEELFQEVKEKVELAVSRGEQIDYLTIVPDGDPILDINLGGLIERLQSLEIKVQLFLAKDCNQVFGKVKAYSVSQLTLFCRLVRQLDCNLFTIII
jgi:wyosine [tRNA(Phe)-imidazoG37] synthetase (radical SAM superfamily)